MLLSYHISFSYLLFSPADATRCSPARAGGKDDEGAGGANEGGKWRRVADWQPCPIGAVLGDVSAPVLLSLSTCSFVALSL